MEEFTVTLTHEDIADITNTMNNHFVSAGHDAPSQGYLEYLMCLAIKKIKSVDFFAEQAKENEREELEREIQNGMKQEADQSMYL